MGSEHHSDAPPPARYGFSTYLAQTWSAFSSAARPAIAVSCALHLLGAYAPYLIFFRIPSGAELPVVFLIRVVIPVMLGSLAVAVISLLMLLRRGEPSASLAEATRLTRSSGSDLLAMSLVATILAIFAVLFLGAYGFIVLHLFYGPVVAVQILVSERMPLRDSLSRARGYLRGNWRLVGYLFAFALLLGLLSFLVLGASFTAVASVSAPWDSIALAALQGLVTGVVGAVVAAAQVALYLEVRALWPEPAAETAA